MLTLYLRINIGFIINQMSFSSFGNNTSGFGQQGNTQNQNTTQSNDKVSDDYNKDVKLSDQVTLQDSVSAIRWLNPTQQMPPPVFAATSWDKSLRIFEVTQNQAGFTIMQKSIANLPFAATCLTWNQDNSAIYVGCIDGVIRTVDTNTMNITEIGKHTEAISSLHYIPGQNVLISTAYQNNVNFWQGNPNPVMTVPVDNKILISDYSNGILAGATVNEKIFFMDMAMIGSGSKTIIDSVDLGKFSQLQSLCLDKKAESLGLTTVDGRTNISSITRNNNVFKTHPLITFKSNKMEESGNVILYPTNASCFNQVLDGWFLTAGSDGTMSFWDYKARNKIKSFSYNAPVCDAKVSATGNMVAYGLGNDWHIGQQGIGKWPNLLGVHFITNQEQKFSGNNNNQKK